MVNLKYSYTDGGQQAAGYEEHPGDYIVRAISIALNLNYKDIYQILNELSVEYASADARKDSILCAGAYLEVMESQIPSDGFVKQKGEIRLDDERLKKGTYILRLAIRGRTHIVCIKDGVLFDKWDSRRVHDCGAYRTAYVYYALTV